MPSSSNFGYPPIDDKLTQLWRQGVRFAVRVAIAFGLSAASAIMLAAAVADNAFVQILITGFATVAFWIPWLLLILSVERMFRRRPNDLRVSDLFAVGTAGIDQRLQPQRGALGDTQHHRLAGRRR